MGQDIDKQIKACKQKYKDDQYQKIRSAPKSFTTGQNYQSDRQPIFTYATERLATDRASNWYR